MTTIMGHFSAEISRLPIWHVKQTPALWGPWTRDHMIRKEPLESAQLTEGRAPERYLYWITGNGHFSANEMGNRVNIHTSVSLNHTQPQTTFTPEWGMKKYT